MPAIQNPKSKIQNEEVLDRLTRLVDKSLVIVEEGRYRLLETVREYAAEQWSGEERLRFGRRHAEYYCCLAAAFRPDWSAAEASAHLDCLEREHDHLRAAVDWAVSQGEAALAWRLGAALGPFWLTRGYWREGRKRLVEIMALEATDTTDTSAPSPILVHRAHALDRAGDLAIMQNDDAAARELFEQSLPIYRRLGDESGRAHACVHLGVLARRREEFRTARALLVESRQLFQQQDDRYGIGMTLSELGQVAEEEGDHPAARAFYQQSLAIWRELNDPRGTQGILLALGRVAYLDADRTAARALFTEALAMARAVRDVGALSFALYVLGSLARLEQEYERAVEYHCEGLGLYRELGDESSIAGSLAALASTLHCLGNADSAAALFKEALQINRRLHNRRQTAHCLEGLAGVLARGRGDGATGSNDANPVSPPPRQDSRASGTSPSPALLTAARLFGAAERLRKGDSPRWPVDQTDYERNLAALQARLDPDTLAAAWAEGAALPLDEAIALALAIE